MPAKFLALSSPLMDDRHERSNQLSVIFELELLRDDLRVIPGKDHCIIGGGLQPLFRGSNLDFSTWDVPPLFRRRVISDSVNKAVVDPREIHEDRRFCGGTESPDCFACGF